MSRGRWIGLGITGLLILLCFWLWTPDKSRDSLELRYANSPSRFVQVTGVRMHLRDTGPRDAPAILMLHGLGSSLHTWQLLANELDERFRVLRIDLPGAGLSGTDPANDYSDERSIAVIAALLDQLQLESVVMMGHSMGGRIAWRFAHALPSRVEKLVLVAPDGFASPGFAYDTPPEVPAMMKLMPYVLPKPLLMTALDPAYADRSAIPEETRSRYFDLMVAPGVRRAMIFRLQQAILKDPLPMLREIDIPVLLIWGAQDAMIPVTNAQDYLAALSDAELFEIPGVGHVPHEEAPGRMLSAIDEFLDGTTTADTRD